MDHSVRFRRVAVLSMLGASALPLIASPALAAGALPAGGNFVAGSGQIAGTASQLTVNQTTKSGIVDWNGFSIGQRNSVRINNGSGATLNRVTGNSPSTIAGSLTSTGSTYVINQNGIVVTPTGKVVTGGSFVASTRDVSNSTFMQGGALEFTGNSGGAASNHGTISAGSDAVLIGKSATNSGNISAPNGTTGVVAGDDVVLQPSGSGLQIQVNTGSGDATNSGNIAAVQANINAVGGNAFALAGNNGGIVRATGTKTINGHVWLTAGGAARVTGTIAAQNATGSGGAIDVQGNNINVSGTLNANATAAKGDGGTITAGSKSVASTIVSGTVEASAGAQGGNGGSIETSGEVLNTTGIKVDTSAPKGRTGNWTLDPYNVTISSAPTANNGASGGSFAPSGNDSVVNVADLQNALQTSNVTVTTGSGGSQSGDIAVAAPVAWSANVLTLDAYHSIIVKSPMSASGTAGLTLTTNDGGSGGDLYFNNGNVTFANTAESLTINGVAYTLLGSMADVQAINNNLSGHFALANSLNATVTSNWIPIGTDGAGNVINGITANGGFSGTFDGLGNTISNLTINLPSSRDVGVFGFSTGIIRNVGSVGGSVSGYANIGSLVGVNYTSARISNSYATGAVNGGSGSQDVGGLVGDNSGTIGNSYATGAISGGSGSDSVGGLVGVNNGGAIASVYATGSVLGYRNTGGLVGFNYSGGTISNAYATGAVNGGNGSEDIGGLVGFNGFDGGTITNSYATGAVSGTSNVGVLVGLNSGTIANSYWDTDQSGQLSGIGQDNNNQAGNVAGETTAQLSATLPSGFSPSVWGNVNNQTTPYLLSNPGPVYVGSDSTHLFTLVFNMAKLQAINASSATLAGDYALANSLNAATDSTTPASWIPIGTDGAGNVLNSSAGFSGIFDGLGNTISNLNINLPSVNYLGLFGLSSGAIRNVGVVGGSVSGFDNVGGLAGYNFTGTISNSYVTGAVSGTSGVGGLVGLNYGAISNAYSTGAISGTDGIGGLVGDNRSSINNAYATGTISGTNNIGGLAGYNRSWISNAYASGAVNGSGNVGGLVGANISAISNAYATGAVSGTAGVGGLVGINYGSGTISSAYATGTVSGNSSVGGLLGYNNGGTLANSYWDTDTSGQSTGIGGDTNNQSGNVSGLTTAQLSAALPGGFEPSIWGNVNSQTTPYLLSIPGPVYIGSDSTHLFTLITTMTQLQAINANSRSLQGDYALANSLNAATDPTTPTSWIPIGTDGAGTVGNSSNGFSGIFDGLGNAISNLTINELSANDVGLFGYSSGTIRNIGMVGGSVTGSRRIANVGGLVGVNDEGTISTSYATAAVTGGWVGGLVGYNIDGQIKQSYATGTVNGGIVGGLVGENVGTISNSYATGLVTGNNFLGGLVGKNDSGTISNSYATGAVSGGSGAFVGGLVGYNSGGFGTISESYATGAVSGGSGATIGGVVAYEDIGVVHTYSDDYFDSQTTGTSAGIGNSSSPGITAATTAQLQGALPAGFDPTVWGTGPGLYAYFLWQYPGGAPQSVSGIAYSDRGATPLSSAATVSVLVNGAGIGSASTGANGYYYVLGAPGTISSGGSQVLAYLSGGAVTGNTLADNATGSISGFSIYGNFLRLTGGGATLSGMAADLNTALGSNSGSRFLFNPGTSLSLKTATSLEIDSTASALNLDQPINAGGGGLFVNSSGSISVNSAISASSGALAVTLDSGTAGAVGYVDIEAPITTGGGNILIGGGPAGPANGAAFGGTSHLVGVTINGALNAGAGSIHIMGNGNWADTSGTADGVDILQPLTAEGGVYIGGEASSLGTPSWAIKITAAISPSNGSVFLNGSGNGDANLGADSVSVGASISASGSISVRADTLTLNAPLNSSSSYVAIYPTTLNRTISVGGNADPGNDLFISSAALGEINAGSLIIGQFGGTGALTITGNVVSPTLGLTLADSAVNVTGGSITDSVPGGNIDIGADSLVLTQPLSAGLYITLQTNTPNRAISASGSVDPGNDLFVSSAMLSEIATNDLNIEGQFAGGGTLAVNGNLASPAQLLRLEDSTVNITGGSVTNTLPGGGINIMADSLALTQPLNAGSFLTLQPFTSNRPVSVGGGTDPGNDLFISSAALSEITANNLTIGEFGGSGTLTVVANITASAASYVTLADRTVNITGGGVTNTTGGISIGADSLALTQPLTATPFIAIQQNTPNRPISVGGSLDPGNDLFVSSAALSAITTNNLRIGEVVGGTGTLTVTGNVVSPVKALQLVDGTVDVAGGGVSSALGSITITANSTAINQPLSTTQGAINITADSLTLAQPVAVSDNFDGITIQPSTPSRPINVGGSSDPGNDLFISSASLSQITLGKLGNLNIGTTADTGTLTVVANTASPVSNLNLTDAAVAIAPGAILSNQNGTFIPNSNPLGSLTIQADNFTVGTGAEIQASNVSVSLLALSPSRPINVGGSADPDPGNDLFISAAALSQITVANAPGFGDLSIGGQGTGTLTVRGNTSSPVEILSLSGSTVFLAPGAVLSDSGTASDIGGPLTGIGVISDKLSFGSGAQIQAPGGLVVFAPRTGTLAVNAGGSIDPGNDLFLSTMDLNSVSAAQLFIRSVKGPLTVSAPLDSSPGGALEHITDVELSSPNATALIANPVTLSSSGALQLLSQNASFSQTAPITAVSLILGGPNLGGNYDLTNPANSFANVTVHRAGTADLVDSTPLNVTGIGVSAIGTAIPAGSTTITDTAAGGITVSGAVNMASGAPLTLYSSGSINVNAPISLNDAPVTLDANVAGNGGYVDIQAPITTNGGNIVIGGGANPLTSTATGTATHVNGVEVNGALDAGTGAITINGQGFAGATGSGIGIDVVAPISTSGANAITLTGTGGGSGASSQSYGVNVANVISATGSGAISITGTGGDAGGSGASNHGVLVSAGSGVTATSLISGNTGALSITGTGSNSSGGGNFGIYTVAKISNSGSITLTANSMHIGASIDPPAATVTLQPLTSSLAVNVGGTSDPGNDLFLSTAELNEISANNLAIGNPADTGPLTITGALTNASGGALQNVGGLMLNSGSGAIAVNNPVTITGSSPFNLALNSTSTVSFGSGGVISATGPGVLSVSLNGAPFVTNFSGANLAGANLNGDNLTGVNLSGSNLAGANLNNSNLTNANLSNTVLTGANLNGTVLAGATVTPASGYTAPTLPAGTNWSGMNLAGMNLSGMNLTGYNLSGANLKGANLTGANLTGTNLAGANLSGAILYGANFTDADLQNASLYGANFQ